MGLDDLIEENKPLAPFTTLGVGGPARWFAGGNDGGARLPRQRRGRGRRACGCLCSAAGAICLLPTRLRWAGHACRLCEGIRALEVDRNERSIRGRGRRGLGSASCSERVDENCAGIECLAGIPGTVGGTPVQNVGAYGQEVSTTIERVRAFDLATHEWVSLRMGMPVRLSAQPVQYCGSRAICGDARGLPAEAGRRTDADICRSAAGIRWRCAAQRARRGGQRCGASASRKACCWSRAIPIATARGAFSRTR